MNYFYLIAGMVTFTWILLRSFILISLCMRSAGGRDGKYSFFSWLIADFKWNSYDGKLSYEKRYVHEVLYSTSLVHESQHLLNFTRKIRQNEYLSVMCQWIIIVNFVQKIMSLISWNSCFRFVDACWNVNSRSRYTVPTYLIRCCLWNFFF